MSTGSKQSRSPVVKCLSGLPWEREGLIQEGLTVWWSVDSQVFILHNQKYMLTRQFRFHEETAVA